MIKVLSLREGATAKLEGDYFVFNGVSGTEFLNTKRTTPILPPKHDLEIKPATIYKIYSGIAFNQSVRTALIDVRPVGDYWRQYGVHVERVEFQDVSPGIAELVVYITAMVGFVLNNRAAMFESLTLGQAGDVEIEEGELPVRAEGFVAVAKRQIQDAGARRPGDAANTTAQEQSDEAKRKKMDDWLNSDDKPGQSVSPGAPAGPITSTGVVSSPDALATSVGKGGVTAAKP